MDQVKQYLRLAAKHHFWILIGVIAVLTLGTWYTTRANLDQQYRTNKGQIEGATQTLASITSEENHPNPASHEVLDRIVESYKAELRELWQKQYDEQGQNLKWPEQAEGRPGLTANFVAQVKDMRPIEVAQPFEADNKSLDTLKDNFKAEYVTYVKRIALPNLAKAVGARWYPAEAGAGTAGGVSGYPAGRGESGRGSTTRVDKTIVEWSAENQSYLQDSRFDWSRETRQGGRPTTLQILYAQEDLWVLETLMNIIAKTNAGADAPHNAVVKQIRYVKLGADAVGRSGSVMRLAALAGPEGGAPGTPGYPTGPSRETMPQTPYGTTPGAAPLVRDPAEGRYVDANYEAIPPSRLRDAFKSTDPKEAFLAVAKRMPVRMHLVVDQRKLHRLLSECGNSNLIVEIRQMRINRPPFEGGGSVGAYGGLAGEYGRGPMPMPRFEGGGFSGGFSGVPGARSGGEGIGGVDDAKPHYDVDVELYGIVYIYNPVNKAMVDVVTDEAVAGVSPPATTAPPVAAPGPAPAVEPAVPEEPEPVEPEAAEPVAPAPVAPAPAAPPAG